MVIAGEVSGDMRAAGLLRALRGRLADASFFGIGGPEMRAAGAETLYDVADMAVMGIPEVARRLPFFYRVFREMRRAAGARRPDAVLLVDFPEFNLPFAAAARRMGLKVIYYVCPQVWAWRRGRIRRMARSVDRLISIFPFEREFFADTGPRVDFVGHPLVAEAAAARAAPRAGLPWSGTPRVALLPGSRANEIEMILPCMREAAARLAARHPGAGFLVASPSERIAGLARRGLAGGAASGRVAAEVVVGRTREVLRQADAALVASGTATLEAALMGCPMAVVYRTSPLTFLVCRFLVRVPHIGMVNLVAGKRLCPEFVQNDATPAALADALEPLLAATPARARMVEGLAAVASALGPPGADERAADAVREEVVGRQSADSPQPTTIFPTRQPPSRSADRGR